MLVRRPGRLAGAIAALLAMLALASGASAAPAKPHATGDATVARAVNATADPQLRSLARMVRALRRKLPTIRRSFVAPQPNIVFVLTDDLSWDLVRYMPNVQRLQRRGTTFTNYFVTDSLCCPSRASILTGQYPHNSGIFRNTGADGGFLAFYANRLEQRTYATALQSVGYRTALLGKYLNQYAPGRIRTPRGEPYIPPGWTDWVVTGNGYPGFGYKLSRNARIVRHGHRPRDYLTNVLAREALKLVNKAVRAGAPFMLNVWTFAPHSPATPAPRDRNRFADLTAPRDASFNEADMLDKPAWLRGHRPLSQQDIERIDEAFRKRVRAVQAVDRMIGRIQRRLRAAGVARDTYIVFSSDNGFHLGQHRLTPGKLTAYDPDVRVPLIVAGPGVPAGHTVDAMAENTDLAPTFAELGGAKPPPTADGRSLVPLLRGETVRDWRDAVLIEHRGNVHGANDPDLPPAGSGNPPTYAALRSKDVLYVEYADGERELYDLKSDPLQLHNIAHEAPPEWIARLSGALAAMTSCRGPSQCWHAGKL